MNPDDIDLMIKKCYENIGFDMDYLDEISIEQKREEKEDIVLLSDICGMLDKGIMIQQ